MATIIAKGQITITDLHDGTNGKTYILNILNGVRSITYNANGSSPSPSQTAFSCELYEDGKLKTPSSYAWSATGLLSGTSTSSTFTPTCSSSFSNANNTIALTVKYDDQTITTSIPISATKIGAAGTNAIIATLDNETHSIPTNSSGNNGNYTGAYTTITIYNGSKDDSANWTISASASAGITGTLSGRTYTVTAMSVDIGYVDLTATRSGYSSVSRRFTLTKTKQGSDGTSPTVYKVSCNTTAISKNEKGVYNPTTITFSATSATGANAPKAYSGRFIIAESTDGSAYTNKYTSSANESSKVYTPTAGIKHIRARLYLAGGTTTLVDEQTIPVVSDGVTGPQGVQGPKGQDGQTYYTWIKYADDAQGTGMSDYPDGKKYIGMAYNKTTVTESTTASDYTWALIQGPQGATGPNGKTYYTWLKYADTPTSGMSDSPDGKKYMGLAYNKTTATESTNYSDYTWSLIKGEDGADGTDGRGVKSTSITYQASTSGTTPPGTWQSTIPTVSAGQYLWTRTTILYTDNTTSDSYSVGKMGEQGKQGNAGKGISSTVTEYQGSTNGTTPPTTGTWSTTIPTVAAGQFLWTRITLKYTDGSSSSSYSVGKMGEQGPQGATGATGTGISSITELYKLLTTKAQQATPTSDTGWSTTPPTWTPGSYLHTCSKIVYKNPTSTAYTKPVCDSSWEAVNEIEIGGRNYIEQGDFQKTNKWTALSGTTTYQSKKCGYRTYNGTAETFITTKRYSYPELIGKNVTLSFLAAKTANVKSFDVHILSRKKGSAADYDYVKTYSPTLNTTLSQYSINYTMPSDIDSFYVRFDNNGSSDAANATLYITNVQLETGNKATDWTPAPEDVTAEIDDVSNALGSLDKGIKDAFGDNIINDAEAKAIASNIQVLENEKADIDKEYTSIYNNTKLAGTAKTNLLNAKTNYDSAHKSLISGINTAIADKKITDAERNSVNSFFSTYRTQIGTYKQRIQEALDYISTQKVIDIEVGGRNLIKNTTNTLQSYSTGQYYHTVANSLTLSSLGLKPGDTVTFRVYIKATGSKGASARISHYYGSTSTATTYASAMGNVIALGKEGYSTVTTTLRADAIDKGIFLGIQSSDTSTTTSATGQFKEAKFEKGNKATDWTQAPEDIALDINKAQTSANTANSQLSDMASDSKLTPLEKISVQKEWTIIQTEWPISKAMAQAHLVSYTACETAYNTLSTYITPILSSMSTTTSITASTFKTNFANYYKEKLNLIKAIQSALDNKVDTVDKNKVDNNQEAIFNKLFADGKQGYVLENGKIYINGEVIKANTISGNVIKAGTLTADKLVIGTGMNGGLVKNPNFSNWSSTYPDGTAAWNSGGISKQTVDGRAVAQFTCSTSGTQYGMSLANSFFANGLNLDGVEYFALEVKFRLTSGTNPSGAAFLVDIYNTDGTYNRLQLNMTEAGSSLTKDTWYTAKKIFQRTSANVAKTFKSCSGYLLANWSGSGNAVKTIQFASANVYIATKQDFLTQSWTTNSTEINGGSIKTGTLDASKITTGTLTANVIKGSAISAINFSTETATISAAKIGSLDASKITSGTISADRIAANSISASKLTIGDLTNYCELNKDTYSKLNFNTVADSSQSNNPWFSPKTLIRDTHLNLGGSMTQYNGQVAGTYRISFEVSSNVKAATASGGSTIDYARINVGLYGKSNTGTNVYYIPSGVLSTSGAAATTWSGTVTLPSSVVSFSVYLQIAGYAPFSGTLKIRNIRVTKMTTGELIVNGAVNGHTIIGATIKNAETNPTFQVTSAGALTCSNATIAGKITASSGKIAGFTISGNDLIGSQVGMSGASGTNPAFWAGSNTSSSAPFRVNHNGSLLIGNKSGNGYIEWTGSALNIKAGSINLGTTSVATTTQLSSKVDSSKIISAINMSNETIKMSANKIDLTGKLDLNGTFKCFENENKTGHYVYTEGAKLRGYLANWHDPVYSCGIWNPTGLPNGETGFVSVGWSNSDHIDGNGCLWMSPLTGGGGEIIFSHFNSVGTPQFSGIRYYKDSYVDYFSIQGAKNNQTIGHNFYGGINTNGYFRGRAIYAEGDVLSLSMSNTPNHLYSVNLQDTGYMFPNGNTQLGTSVNPWYMLVTRYANQVVSDARAKKEIKYIQDNAVATMNLSDDQITTEVSLDDMYNYIKDDLKLATYQMKDAREKDVDRQEIGFLIQDIKDSKVGEYICDTNDEENYIYDTGNRISVIEGALKKAIQKIEELEKQLKEKEY